LINGPRREGRRAGGSLAAAVFRHTIDTIGAQVNALDSAGVEATIREQIFAANFNRLFPVRC
jgi:hypothetical protein